MIRRTLKIGYLTVWVDLNTMEALEDSKREKIEYFAYFPNKADFAVGEYRLNAALHLDMKCRQLLERFIKTERGTHGKRNF